jgi:hypothetical protein
MANSIAASVTKGSVIKAILISGFIAGTLDMLAAIISSGAKPVIICQYIASAVFGRETAFSGGLMMALAGLLFHYFIAYAWTSLFFVLYPRIKWLSRNIYVTGVLYGIAVWTAMNLIVVPLSRITPRPLDWTKDLIGMSIIIFMIGLPIALSAQRFYNMKLKRG